MGSGCGPWRSVRRLHRAQTRGPDHEEFAMGALASGGRVVVNDDVVRALRVHAATAARVAEREGRELIRREAAYRGGRPPVDVDRQDGDPRRRRPRHRGQHARRGAGAAGSGPRRDRDRGAGGSGIDLPGIRRHRRRRGVRDDADTLSRSRGVVLGLQPGKRRGGARIPRHPDHRLDAPRGSESRRHPRR